VFRPDIKVDQTTWLLLAVAVSPWLSGVLKGVELPGGLKLEYRGDEDRRSAGAMDEHDHGQLSPSKRRSAQQETKAPQLELLADDYYGRLVKLTPVEPIAIFIVMSSLMKSSRTRAEAPLEWGIFGLLVILAPIFFRKLGVSRFQTISMTLAFCVWIFAIGGPFTTLYWYRSWYGGLTLALFMSVLPQLIWLDDRPPNS
jgi:hypothetical protein